MIFFPPTICLLLKLSIGFPSQGQQNLNLCAIGHPGLRLCPDAGSLS